MLHANSGRCPASGWTGGLKCKYGVEWLRGGRCLPHPRCMAHMASSLPVVSETIGVVGVNRRPRGIKILSEMVKWAVARAPYKGKLGLKVKEGQYPRKDLSFCHFLYFYTNILVNRQGHGHPCSQKISKTELNRKRGKTRISADVFFFNDPTTEVDDGLT